MNLQAINAAIGAFFNGIILFVKGAAPIAKAAGAATGNPEVVAAAKLAEVVADSYSGDDRRARPPIHPEDTGHRTRLTDE
jgi:hypothetical protein